MTEPVYLQLAALMLANGALHSSEVNTESILVLMKENLVSADTDKNGDKFFVLTGHGWYRWPIYREALLGESQAEAEVTMREAMRALTLRFGG